MKKHLFLIASVFTAFSLQAQTPTVKVMGNTTVKVKPQTLFYVDGNMDVAPYTDAQKKVSNEGYVKITENLKTGYKKEQSNSTASFVNELVGAGNYGQLIVNNGSDKNEGKIASGVKFNPNFNFQSIGVPYTGITAGDLVREVFPGKSDVSAGFRGYTRTNGVYDPNRYKNVLFFWDNDIYSLVQLAEGDNLDSPERYYAVSSFSALGNFSTGAKIHLSGVPFKDNKTVIVNPYTPANSKDTNKYGEYYGSYIVDFTTTPPDGWVDFAKKGPGVVNSEKYGANIYYFGNPYTSNIDLTKGGNFAGATIYQEGYNNYDENLTVAAAETSGVIASTSQGAGDAKFVRPFGTFGAKFSDEQPHTITFSDEMKTFVIPSDASNVLLNKGDKGSVVINQVGLDLYDANGFTGAKTYVVASDVYEAAQKGEGTEVYNISMTEKSTGIYTLQENEDGSVNEELSNGKTYINGVNANKYVGKPIHLAFQNGKGKYTLKARLNESLEKNKNAFYFEDKVTGKVIKVEKDFEYSFDINGTDKDRFVLYWAATPNTKPVDEVVKEEANATVVYKDFDTYKVRFDKSTKNAEVFVYNISGQLISSAKSVDTSVDYIVPLKGNTGVYIVKVIGDNGKVVTKKIIK